MKNEEKNRKSKIRDCGYIYKRRSKKTELSEFRCEFFRDILSCSIGGYPLQQIYINDINGSCFVNNSLRSKSSLLIILFDRLFEVRLEGAHTTFD
jgi:hypothetical protein